MLQLLFIFYMNEIKLFVDAFEEMMSSSLGAGVSDGSG